MKIFLKKMILPMMVGVLISWPQALQAMEAAEKPIVFLSNSSLPQKAEQLILKVAVKDHCSEFGFAGNLGPVCKAWDNFINKEMIYPLPFNNSPKFSLQEFCLYDIFYHGELIYRPNLENDEGMRRLKISELENPLEGKFDLSLCGEMNKVLSIHTGYRKEMIKENVDKVEVWFAPRKLIKKELQEGRASQLATIFLSWEPSAVVAIFWTWGSDKTLEWWNFDWLGSRTTSSIASRNLYDNWWLGSGGWGVCPDESKHSLERFYAHFK